MKESQVKYLAGLLDADGCLGFHFTKVEDKWRVYLRLTLVAAESVDKDGKFIKALPSETGMGRVQTTEYGNGWSRRNDWVVSKWSDQNKLLPRIIKHMVVKGRHWQWMYEQAHSLRGQQITHREKELLVEASKESRKFSGPVKPKNHPTWAWIAGYLDGDGSFQNKYNKKKKHQAMRVNATSHKNDSVGLELLQKAFGGLIYQPSPNIMRWQQNLGYANTSFAKKFLSKIVTHSRLKKYKIERLLHNHRQRLIEKTPTGEETV